MTLITLYLIIKAMDDYYYKELCYIFQIAVMFHKDSCTESFI